MTDRQLTTRDLAETSDTDADAQADSEQKAPDRNALAESSENRETLGETTATGPRPPAKRTAMPSINVPW